MFVDHYGSLIRQQINSLGLNISVAWLGSELERVLSRMAGQPFLVLNWEPNTVSKAKQVTRISFPTCRCVFYCLVNPLTPRAFCQKCIFVFWDFGDVQVVHWPNYLQFTQKGIYNMTACLSFYQHCTLQRSCSGMHSFWMRKVTLDTWVTITFWMRKVNVWRLFLFLRVFFHLSLFSFLTFFLQW